MGQMPSEADLRPLAAVDRVSRRRLRFTSAAIVPAISGTARNVTSTFARGKSQALVDPAAVAPDVRGAAARATTIAGEGGDSWTAVTISLVLTHSQPTLRGEDVLVIEPGSRYLRIGLASQGLPRTVPHVLARRYRPAAPFDGGGLCGLFEELPSQVRVSRRPLLVCMAGSVKWRALVLACYGAPAEPDGPARAAVDVDRQHPPRTAQDLQEEDRAACVGPGQEASEPVAQIATGEGALTHGRGGFVHLAWPSRLGGELQWERAAAQHPGALGPAAGQLERDRARVLRRRRRT